MKRIVVIFLFLTSHLFGQDTLNTAQFEVNDCIQLYDGPIVIRTRNSLDSLIRKDASSERCQEHLKDLDLDNFSLLGINLNTGYCQFPTGLTFSVVKTVQGKRCTVLISYIEPLTPCRALISYKLWIKVPSIPEDFDVKFVVTPLPYQE
jgi:hypothetical protein